MASHESKADHKRGSSELALSRLKHALVEEIAKPSKKSIAHVTELLSFGT